MLGPSRNQRITFCRSVLKRRRRASLDCLPAVSKWIVAWHGQRSGMARCDPRLRGLGNRARAVCRPDVEDLVVETIDTLTVPRHGRGAEFIAGDFKTTYEPEWFYDGKLEGVCNHLTREHMPRDLHRYLYAACFARHHGYSPRLTAFPGGPSARTQECPSGGRMAMDISAIVSASRWKTTHRPRSPATSRRTDTDSFIRIRGSAVA